MSQVLTAASSSRPTNVQDWEFHQCRFEQELKTGNTNDNERLDLSCVGIWILQEKI